MRREQIGIVFQSSNLLASVTATDQLLVLAHLAGENMDDAAERARQLLDAVGLSAQGEKQPHQLATW